MYDGCRESFREGKRLFFSPIFFGQEPKKIGPPEAGPGDGSARVGNFRLPEKAPVVADAHIGHKPSLRIVALWPMWASATTECLMLHCTRKNGNLPPAHFPPRETDCHTAFCVGKNADIGHWFAMTGLRLRPIQATALLPEVFDTLVLQFNSSRSDTETFHFPLSTFNFLFSLPAISSASECRKKPRRRKICAAGLGDGTQSTSFLVWCSAMYARILPRSVWSMGYLPMTMMPTKARIAGTRPMMTIIQVSRVGILAMSPT